MKEMEKENEIEIQESPLRPIFCLKRKVDMKPFDEIYDCFILDFDPGEPLHSISNLSLSTDDELSIVAERGQVACRDYPHPRHLCLKYPFEKTPHENYCHLLHLACTGQILNQHIVMPQSKLMLGSRKES
ncbi:uncharacterized protein LOC105640806 isoform X2 [Jatropha curcas]|uniref:uncharacterized protein LOC105640806 isoform X2 n=1 Tax=Jatropha curcas TaxID=180498 RepID=UPI0005FB7A13|nr:uncharacterized protein LOC105640806 isoform X2 [Jatropha curcas]